MTNEEFEKLFCNRLKEIEILFRKKTLYYAKNKGDRFYHTKVLSKILNCNELRALYTCWAKHIATLESLITDFEKNKNIPKDEILSEVVNDLVIYPILMEGLFKSIKQKGEVHNET